MIPLVANYHTHTFRCRHARGTDRDYVEAAIRAGMRTLGFSDHAPMIFPKEIYGDHYSGFRMRPEETADYFASLLALREAYKRDVTILIGVEVEYYPDCFPGFLEFMRQFPLDYMILGQHYVGNEKTCPPVFKPTDDVSALDAYYETVLEAVATGKFLYIAHPDVFHFIGDEQTFLSHTRRFLERLRPLNPVLEINQHGCADNRNYPCEAFWRLAGELGFSAVIGVDAHDPKELLAADVIARCAGIAARNGVRLLSELPVG